MVVLLAEKTLEGQNRSRIKAAMKSFSFLLLLITGIGALFAQEMTLTSKDGRKISATIIRIHDDSVEFRRDDGEEFTIAFEKFDQSTVEALKKIALEEKEAAIAEQKKKMAAEEAELARIPKFPEKPKTGEDLPQKIVFNLKNEKVAYYAFERVKSFFVEPTKSPSPSESDPVLNISTASGGGEVLVALSHNLTDGSVRMKLIIRTGKEAELPEPVEISILSMNPKSVNGVAQAGYYAKRVSEDVTEIILYDFQVVE